MYFFTCVCSRKIDIFHYIRDASNVAGHSIYVFKEVGLIDRRDKNLWLELFPFFRMRASQVKLAAAIRATRATRDTMKRLEEKTKGPHKKKK